MSSGDDQIEPLAGPEEFETLAEGSAVRDAPDDAAEGDEADVVAEDSEAAAGPSGKAKRKAKPKPIFPMPDPALDLCPVTPLGGDVRNVVFAMPDGELRVEPAAKIGPMLRTDIFVCVAGASFLTLFRNSQDQFEQLAAHMWFVRACRAKGKFDHRRPRRLLGVWPGPRGEAILHKGDEIWTYDEAGRHNVLTIAEAMKVSTGPLYLLHAKGVAPEKPASAEAGAWIRSWLENWRFERIGPEPAEGADWLTGADVVMGFIGQALLGAVPDFRVHVLINALAGSGKTTLMEFVHAVLAALTGDFINRFTESGFRTDIAGMARPVVIDEPEASAGGNGPGPVEGMMETLRLMSTGHGAVHKMGGLDGSVTQTAVGSVIMAAINPPRIDGALATRVAEFKLLPLVDEHAPPPPPGQDRPKLATKAEIEAARLKGEAIAPALLARALTRAGRFRADVAAMIGALTSGGEVPRTADLIATLAAGRRLMLSDEALTPETALEEARLWQGLLDHRAAVSNVSNPGADALGHLFGVVTDKFSNDRRMSIGQLVDRWAKRDMRSDVEELLKWYGLRLFEKDGAPYLVVVNQHPKLEEIFGRSKWPDWRRTFEYLDALGPAYKTEATKNNVKLGLAGRPSRGIVIPLTPWLESGAAPGVGRSGSGGGNGGVPGIVPSYGIDPDD